MPRVPDLREHTVRLHDLSRLISRRPEVVLLISPVLEVLEVIVIHQLLDPEVIAITVHPVVREVDPVALTPDLLLQEVAIHRDLAAVAPEAPCLLAGQALAEVCQALGPQVLEEKIKS